MFADIEMKYAVLSTEHAQWFVKMLCNVLSSVSSLIHVTLNFLLEFNYILKERF